MCSRLGVGVQFFASYAHHMLGKAERPWRTIRDNDFAMLHSKAVPNSMWSCAVNTVVYLHNRTPSRSPPRSAPQAAFLSHSLRRRCLTHPSSASSGALSSPKCQSSCVVNSMKKRFAASWLAARLTPRGTACTAQKLVASPPPSMLSSKKTLRASAHAFPLTRPSPTVRMTSHRRTFHPSPTLSTPPYPTLNPLLQLLVRLDSGHTPLGTCCPHVRLPADTRHGVL
jgi:hypothetical protein